MVILSKRLLPRILPSVGNNDHPLALSQERLNGFKQKANLEATMNVLDTFQHSDECLPAPARAVSHKSTHL